MNKPRGPVIDRARIRELKAQGMGTLAIAARMGCSRQTVREALKEAKNDITSMQTLVATAVDQGKERGSV